METSSDSFVFGWASEARPRHIKVHSRAMSRGQLEPLGTMRFIHMLKYAKSRRTPRMESFFFSFFIHLRETFRGIKKQKYAAVGSARGRSRSSPPYQQTAVIYTSHFPVDNPDAKHTCTGNAQWRRPPRQNHRRVFSRSRRTSVERCRPRGTRRILNHHLSQRSLKIHTFLKRTPPGGAEINPLSF